MVNPFSAGTLTLQEAPSFAWRTNDSTFSREPREHTTAKVNYPHARVGGCNVLSGRIGRSEPYSHVLTIVATQEPTTS
jgi:hypothetical protein